MNINEALKLKRKLEADIHSMLTEFQEQTGLTVSDVDLVKVSEMSLVRPRLVDVNVVVQL